MLEKSLTIQLAQGLHARPASEFVKAATSFQSEVHLSKQGKKVNAKSIMGLMSLAVKKGDQITLTVDGADESKAMAALETLLVEGNE
ncbi:HPr family phosphocarrier protein [Fodinisporobacter ferrooxydans]|uniref:Phosphocarrier protein HPr n=1 Tax=Fodinisporobacter ferrooxydans TaxID=2901836 RepID=A0ABY4CQ34_9BACL|nr:HPr family phosphocarrier protein [Alicyclobacillaceae bacterium MYW30-H2]